jgi:hypothetical protein
MFRNQLLAFLIIGVLSTQVVHAYNAKWHERVARIAAELSILGNKRFTDDVGFDELPFVINEVDYDELSKDQCMDESVKKNIMEFLYCGAVQEDEENLVLRGINHFYDPIYDQALDLNYMGDDFYGANKAPDWALEDFMEVNSFAIIEQNYSLKHAYEYYSRMLTNESKAVREKNEALLFKTLGHVVHMVNDMAQPEHVRNDQHLDGSIFEVHSEFASRMYSRATGTYEPIDLNEFDEARRFFYNEDNTGLSQFTNNNFISVDTNFGIRSDGTFFPRFYASPQPIEKDESEIVNKVPANDVLGTRYFHGEVWFVSNEVRDDNLNNGIEINQRASALNLFSHELTEVKSIMARKKSFAVNRGTFNAALAFLVPRAISYGTGMINYFFRGHIDVKDVFVFNGSGPGVTVGLTVTNTTGRDNPGGEEFNFIPGGTFSLYYDLLGGGRRQARIATNSPNSSELYYTMSDQDTRTFHFEIGSPGSWDRSKPMTLVYDGRIGFERGLAVKVFYPKPLLAFNVRDGNIDGRIDVFKSYDLGYSWELNNIIQLPFSDSTIDPMNSLRVENAVNLGNGSVLAIVSYYDYLKEDGTPGADSSWVTVLRSDDYGSTWASITDFDWSPLLAGSGNVFDAEAIYKSVVYEGDDVLAALRVQLPVQGVDPAQEPRKFQLMRSYDLGRTGTWTGREGLGIGGYPEIDYLGAQSYVFAGLTPDYNGQDVSGTDSVISRTNNWGSSFYELPEIESACSELDTSGSEQHMLYLGDDRILGWAQIRRYRLEDYSNKVILYLSENGGGSWAPSAEAPFTQTCESLDVRQGNVVDVLLIGKSQKDKDVMIARTKCREVYVEQNGNTTTGYDVGDGLFVTIDSGEKWHEVSLPQYFNSHGILMYTGDNGAIPGLYRPIN